jgi:Helix-turn-helix domain of resolvase
VDARPLDDRAPTTSIGRQWTRNIKSPVRSADRCGSAETDALVFGLPRRLVVASPPPKGRLRGKQPKLSPRQEAHLVELYRAGGHTIGELEELFPVTRSTIYRAVARAGGRATGTSAQSATR